LSVCGEAAGNPGAACLLVGMGVRDLSMNPFQSSRVRRVLRQLTLEQMEAVFRDASSVGTPEDVQRVLDSSLHGTDA
jgi:phosphoenolpyruvate-protein kinase (PTS system EI component)